MARKDGGQLGAGVTGSADDGYTLPCIDVRFSHGQDSRKNSAGGKAAAADGSSHAIGKRRGRGRSAEGHEDGVAAADGAEDAVDGGGVDGAGHRLRAGDSRADDDEVAAG